jgi:acyl-CoA reductase-like NAD-dependent aldehyde dehydrogenase
MLDRFLKFSGISEREGAEIIMRGKALPNAEKGHYVTPSIARFNQITVDQLRKSVSLQTEILSPHVSIIGFETEDELQALSLVMTHGRLASVWTEDLEKAQRFAIQFPAGEVVINGSVCHHPGWLTTQARKRSGNQALLGHGLINQLVLQKLIHT